MPCRRCGEKNEPRESGVFFFFFFFFGFCVCVGVALKKKPMHGGLFLSSFDNVVVVVVVGGGGCCRRHRRCCFVVSNIVCLKGFCGSLAYLFCQRKSYF